MSRESHGQSPCAGSASTRSDATSSVRHAAGSAAGGGFVSLCRLDPAIGSGRAALGCRKAGSMGERGEPWCRGDPLDGDAGGESSGGAAVIEAGRARVRWDRWSVRIGLDLGVQRRGGAGSGRERRGAWEAQWTTAVRVRAAACASASGFWRVLGLGLPRAISLGQRAVRAALWQAGGRWGRIASEGMQRGSKSRSRAKRRFYGCSRRVAARVRRSWTPWPLGWGPRVRFIRRCSYVTAPEQLHRPPRPQ